MELLKLCDGLRKMGAVQVTYGTFQATFEPPMPTLNLNNGAVIYRPDGSDDVGEEELKEIARIATARRKQVERELYGASEGV